MNSNILVVGLSRSKMVQKKYKYLEAIENLQNEIDGIKNKNKVNNENIKTFIELVQADKLNICVDQFSDIYKLSEYFCISRLTTELDKIIKEKVFHNLNFIIQMLINHHRQDTEKNSHREEETELWSKIKKHLSERVNECIENRHFFELPSSVVYRIFEKNSCAKIDSNKLVELIFERIGQRFIFFRFIELHQLREEKIEFVIENYERLGENKKKYFEYMSIDIQILQETRDKMNKATIENESIKEELELTKKKLLEMIEKHKKILYENIELKSKYDETLKEKEELKNELEQLKMKFEEKN